VVTEINPEERFWQAEPEHQDYLQRRPSGYSCHFIRPNWRLPSAPAFQNPRTAEGPKN
jgi:peptide-methionine (S)-S-oxide reductase